MENRIKELRENLPLTKEALDQLINCIASHIDIIDDSILNNTIKKLEKDIRVECQE